MRAFTKIITSQFIILIPMKDIATVDILERAQNVDGERILALVLRHK
jgi:hypothetical protein